MPRGSKDKYTDKQKRKADHIEEGYEARGVSPDEAERRAWATVNAQDGGGREGGRLARGQDADERPMDEASMGDVSSRTGDEDDIDDVGAQQTTVDDDTQGMRRGRASPAGRGAARGTAGRTAAAARGGRNSRRSTSRTGTSTRRKTSS